MMSRGLLSVHGFILRFAMLAIVAAVATVSSMSHANAQSLDEILSRKKIVVGLIQDFPPFGFINAEQRPAGYDVDVAQLMGKYLGVDVELVPVSGANRIPYLLSKRVDILVASLGITPERAKQVVFTIPYAATQSTVIAPVSTRIKTLDDLAGIRVAVARGSSNDIFISKMAPKGINLQRFDGEGVTSQALLSGQVQALVMTNTMLPSVLKSAGDNKLESKIVLQQQENAIALRRDAMELRQWINTFIYYIKNNGELDAIHRKWLEAPLPTLRTF